MMENRVEYFPIFVGLSSIGVITSLINYNIRGDSLKHCLEVCNCKGIIFDTETTAALDEIKVILIDLKIDLYCFASKPVNEVSPLCIQVNYLVTLMDGVSSAEPPAPQNVDVKQDTSIYLYTSGTTGLPKAVVVKTIKLISIAVGFCAYVNYEDDGVLYETLPLYHGNGFYLTISAFSYGVTTVIKKRFSASHYMADCCKYNVTVINYIGETCRYILAQPRRDYDQNNKIRIAIGNGLRASIWTEFKTRFNISTICEFYGSTEGNIVLCPNYFGRVGAVCYMPSIIPNRSIKLIKVDPETGDIVRGDNGIAVEAQPGEPGEIVGVIHKYAKFEGYTDKAATKKKICHDIFRKGDAAFLSGDILVKDEEGFFYFRDRTGDTFRWKGENVSTNEVEGLLSKVLGLQDVCVYGVEVPGMEGKAGIACIQDPQRKTKMEDLHASLDEVLPKYAQPVFVRLANTVDVTGTFKFQKSKLRKEGFNPHACGEDALYYYDIKEENYLRLDAQIYQEILDTNVRF